MRIASLVPAGTDLVVALGLADALVGISHECDHPEAAGLPVLTSSNVPAAGVEGGSPPAEVDAAVSTQLAAGDALYRTDAAQLAALAPDIVVAQDICDVCALPADHALSAVPPTAELVVLHATSIDGLVGDVRHLADALGATAAGDRVVAGIESTLAEVADAVAGRRRPRVTVLEWIDPLFLGGHWVPELVERAGGHHVPTGPGVPSPRADLADVLDARPDIVIAAPCGYDLAAVVTATTELAGRLDGTPAGERRALWAVDATRLLSRCTPAAVTSAVQVLAGILHPDAVPMPGPLDAVRVSVAARR